MKKLLSILGSLSIISTATITTVVSCQAVAPDRTYNGLKSIEELWDTRSAYTISIGSFYDETAENEENSLSTLNDEIIRLIQYRFNYEENEKIKEALTDDKVIITFNYLNVDYTVEQIEVLIKNLGEKNEENQFFTIPLTFSIKEKEGSQLIEDLKFNLTNKGSFRADFEEESSNYKFSYMKSYNTTNSFVELQSSPEAEEVLWLNDKYTKDEFSDPDPTVDPEEEPIEGDSEYVKQVKEWILKSFIETIDNENYNNSISIINREIGINKSEVNWGFNTAITTIKYDDPITTIVPIEPEEPIENWEFKGLIRNETNKGNYSAKITLFGQDITVKSTTGVRTSKK